MLSSDLRHMIQEFVDARVSLSELEEWLVPRLPYYLRSADTPDANAVAVIELGLAEVNDGIRTVTELQEQLRAVLRQNNLLTISYPRPERHIETGTASRTIYPTVSPAGARMTIQAVQFH